MFGFLKKIVGSGIDLIKSIIPLIKILIPLVTGIFDLFAAIVMMIAHMAKNPQDIIMGVIFIAMQLVRAIVMIPFVGYPIGATILAVFPFFPINLMYVTFLYLLYVGIVVMGTIPMLLLFFVDMAWLTGKDSMVNISENGLQSVLDSNKKQYSIYQFAYRYFHANEKSPDMWHTLNSNNMPRSTDGQSILLKYPCMTRYVHDSNDLFCTRMPDYLPTVSPQGTIYQLSKEGRVSVKGPVMPVPLSEQSDYKSAKPARKYELLLEYTDRLKKYYEAANAEMQPYDTVSKNVCRACDMGAESDIADLRALCYQTYCVNGRWENFCVKLSPVKPLSFQEKWVDTMDPVPKTFVYLGLIATCLLVVMVVYISLRKNVRLPMGLQNLAIR